MKQWGHDIPSRTVKYPIPDRWAEFARAMTQTQACEHFNVSKNVVRRWQRLTGIVCRAHVRPLPKYPPSFPATAHERTAEEWAALTGRTAQVVRQWARKLGVQCRPVPRGNKPGYVYKVGKW